MSSDVFSCRDLSVELSGRRILSEVNLSCAAHRRLAVMGASGCGKTTLLRTLAGLLSPSAGSLRCAGKPKLVFQDSRLLPWETVLDNVTVVRPRLNDVARQMLTLVGLGGKESMYPHQLSGGMQRRVALVRAFLHCDDLLLLDEPFTGLDPKLRRELRRVLNALWQRTRPAAVMVTHDIEDALDFAERVVFMWAAPSTGGPQRFERMDLLKPNDDEDSPVYRAWHDRMYHEFERYLIA